MVVAPGRCFGGHNGDHLSADDVPRGSGISPRDFLDAAIELIGRERTDQEIRGALAETLQDEIGVVVSEQGNNRHAGNRRVKVRQHAEGLLLRRKIQKAQFRLNGPY